MTSSLAEHCLMTRSLAELDLHGQITAVQKNRKAEQGHQMLCTSTVITFTWKN